MKINENIHITKDGVIKNNPPSQIVTLEFMSSVRVDGLDPEGKIDKYDLIGMNIDERGLNTVNKVLAREDLAVYSELKFIKSTKIQLKLLYKPYTNSGYGQLVAITLVVCSRQPTEKEIKMIMDELTGQFSDGFGESFEQISYFKLHTDIDDRNTPEVDAYVYLWQDNRHDEEYYIKLNAIHKGTVTHNDLRIQ